MYSFQLRSRVVYIIFGLIIPITSVGQRNTQENEVISVNKIFTVVENLGKTESQLLKQFKQYIYKIEKQDRRIYKRLLKKDSTLALRYREEMLQKVKDIKGKTRFQEGTMEYIPALDTLKGMFFSSMLTGAGNQQKKYQAAEESIHRLQNTLAKSQELQNFLKQRKEFLKEQLTKLGLTKELIKINKQVYYYSQQLNEYKAAINDPKLFATKAFEIIKKTKLFKDFMEKNSMLAALFRLPENALQGNTADIIEGLQTRAQINNLIQQQIANRGPNAQSAFRQNMQEAQSSIAQLKNKVQSYGNNGSEDIMPEGFRPNSQKTKTVLQRLEYGVNMQSQKATNYFPTTSDIAISVGYKLNEKSVIGIGASFKLGFGRGWDNIKLSTQGVGLRSFIDWKLKGSLYISGGYEQNYRNAITSIGQLQNISAWQQSGLLGISKKVTLKNKWLKGSKIQLLYDFLSGQQFPAGPAIVFRVGYTIKYN